MADWLERVGEWVCRLRSGRCVEESRVEMEELMGLASGVGESKRVGTAQKRDTALESKQVRAAPRLVAALERRESASERESGKLTFRKGRGAAGAPFAASFRMERSLDILSTMY